MLTKIIKNVAEQLCQPFFIRDYDVAYKVATIYVQIRIKDSIEKCRKYHIERLKYKKNIPEMIENSKWVGGWTISNIPPTNTKQNIFKATLALLATKRGVRQPQWKIYNIVWDIQDWDKDKLTLRDKLNDMKFISNYIIKQIASDYRINQRKLI